MILPSKVFVALALLVQPPGSAEPKDPARLFNLHHTTLQQLAISLEILDPRETRYIMARQEDFVADLNMLRRRYHMYADAPLLSDHLRFPDKAIANQLVVANREYRQGIDARMPLDLLEVQRFQIIIREIDYLYQVWDAVRDARCDYYYITVRRGALKRLRELIGDEAYYECSLPPAVPLWRFVERN